MLYTLKRPEEMSDLLPLFFANIVPYFALVWSLSLLLFYKDIFGNLFKLDYDYKATDRTIILWINLALTGLYLILPIRTLINNNY